MFEKLGIQKKSVYALLVIVLSFSISGCSFLPKEEPVLAPPMVEPVEAEYNTVEVKKGDIYATVDGNAHFTSVDLMNLNYEKPGGRISKINVKVNDKVRKGDILIELENNNALLEIQQTLIDLEKIELQLKELKKDNADKASLDMALLDKKAVEHRLQHLRNTLEESRLRAPMDGFVTSIAKISEGEWLNHNRTLVQIANLENLTVIFKPVYKDLISSIVLGADTTLTFMGEQLKGKVLYTPNDLPEELASESTFKDAFIIEVEDDLPEEAEFGRLVEVSIFLSKSEDTLIIPVRAIQVNQNETFYVQIVDEELTLREVEVLPGIMNLTEAEILEGLELGDQVIVR